MLSTESDFNLKKWTQPLDKLSNDIIVAINGEIKIKKDTQEDNSTAKEQFENIIPLKRIGQSKEMGKLLYSWLQKIPLLF